MSQYSELSNLLTVEFENRLERASVTGHLPVSDLWDDVNGTIPWTQIKMILSADLIKRIKAESNTRWLN
ncbi:MAG: hypothetical protein HOJ16_00095 [Candidatus Peribacter sp.]|jgi:hypothetical protein|nr:hypothetical protein [Candidatus Peribacter sp.]